MEVVHDQESGLRTRFEVSDSEISETCRALFLAGRSSGLVLLGAAARLPQANHAGARRGLRGDVCRMGAVAVAHGG